MKQRSNKFTPAAQDLGLQQNRLGSWLSHTTLTNGLSYGQSTDNKQNKDSMNTYSIHNPLSPSFE